MSTTTLKKEPAAKKPKVAKTKPEAAVKTAPFQHLLPQECGSGLKITFEGIVGKFTSDFGGSFTYAKRISMAYAVASRTNSTWTGIGMVDLTKAFEIIAFEPATNHITVKLTEEAKQHSMDFATADLSFLNQPRPSVAAMYGYNDYSRNRYDRW